MLDRMELVVSAVLPLVLLLGLGAFLRQRVLTDPSPWRGLETMTYWVFTPALFVTAIAETDLSAVAIGPFALSLAVPVLVLAVLVVVLRRPLGLDGPEATSVVQGVVRFNTYLGLVFANALDGARGVAMFAVAAAIMVPLVNVVSVVVLSRLGEHADGGRRPRLWRELVGNPFILGSLVGLVVNVTGLPLPEVVGTTLHILSSAALACGTLAVGAAVIVRVRRRDVAILAGASLVKLALVPLAAAGLALLLGVGGAPLTAIVLICALPTAPSAFVLASRMGGDAPLMASITGVQTVLSLATVPVALVLIGAA